MESQKLTVLLVADAPPLLGQLAAWLEPAGYQVACAGDGRSAMAAIGSHCPDIVITDGNMPDGDGVQLCRWLRQEPLPRYVYTVFLTVSDNLPGVVAGLEAGADAFLAKPVVPDQLLAYLRCGRRIHELESRLLRLSQCDPLTGLATQRTLYEQAAREWSRSARHHHPLSCVMLDIDFFKPVNDRYGHLVGDQVLRTVADLLRCETRISDILSRYGGDEFCILLPETPAPGAQVWAERFRRRLATAGIQVAGHELHITTSLGVAGRTPPMTGPEALVNAADQALLQAKRLGRNRVLRLEAAPALGSGIPS